MGFGNYSRRNAEVSQRTVLENKYRNARGNLLIVIAFTLINIILAFTGGTSYFLFSAAIPYAFVLYGLIFCGKMPEEWYEGETFEFWDSSVLVVLTVSALVILAFYGLCWWLSKNHKKVWLVVALVMFVLDTIGMFFTGLLMDLSAIIDIAFHVWVIVSLVSGISAVKKLEKLPPEETETVEATDAPIAEGVFEELETPAVQNEIAAESESLERDAEKETPKQE